MTEHLRPIERRILALRDQGQGVPEIARRIRRSPDHVERIIGWTRIPRSRPSPQRSPRPFESRVLALRSRGESHEQIAFRFNKSPGFIRRVDGLAHYTMALDLLSDR